MVWWVGLGWSWWPRSLVLLGLGSLGRSVVVVRSVGGPVGRSVRWLVVVGLFLVHVPHPDSYFLSVHARPWARTSLRCCDTEIDRHPHVVGSSGIFTDVTLPPQGAGHLAVIVLLRVRFSGGVFVKGVLVGRTVPPLAILALFFFRFRQGVSTTGGRRRRGNLLAVGRHSPRDPSKTPCPQTPMAKIFGGSGDDGRPLVPNSPFA